LLPGKFQRPAEFAEDAGLFLSQVPHEGGLVDPQLRASREHILIVRPLRAQGIDQAALVFGTTK